VKKRFYIISIIYLLCFKSVSKAQDVIIEKTWLKWKFLIGDWADSGNTTNENNLTFSFHIDLEDKILIRQSHLEYVATGDKPAKVHSDLMIIYLDNANIPNKAIYFDNDGKNVLYSITFLDNDTKIVFTSNNTGGTHKYRFSYTKIDEENVMVIFESTTRNSNKYATYMQMTAKKLQ